MQRFSLWAAALLVPLALVASACGGDDEREALREDELERELDLALEGDTFPATFEDTAAGVEPVPAPAARTTAPRPRTTRPQPSAPRSAPSAPRTVTRSVPAGTTFAVRLNQTLSTESSQVGQGFTATLSDPIIAADGTVLVPSGAVVHGRVTALDKSDRVGETAVIKVAFESISFGGQSYGLDASVVEANPERRTRTSTTQSAAKVAAGAAAGAILGQVLGKDKESTLKGAAIGAAAGTAIAMGTADVDAVLPAGSRMVIRLDAPIQVQRTVS